jgi:hypothetical protein
VRKTSIGAVCVCVNKCVCVCASVLASEGVGRSTKGYWIAARFGVLQVYGIKVSCDKF